MLSTCLVSVWKYSRRINSAAKLGGLICLDGFEGLVRESPRLCVVLDRGHGGHGIGERNLTFIYVIVRPFCCGGAVGMWVKASISLLSERWAAMVRRVGGVC